MSNNSSRHDPSPRADDFTTSNIGIKRKSSNVGEMSSLTPPRAQLYKIQKLIAAAVDTNQTEQVLDGNDAEVSSIDGCSSVCTLYFLPWEIRDQIFKSVLDDYFDEHRDRRTLIYQDFLEGIWEQKEKHFKNSSNPQYRSRKGLNTCELPALEIALIPEQRLYREIFRLRIKSSIVELRPSVAWDWKYDFYVLSPEAEAVAKPPQELLTYGEGQNWESWDSEYDHWLEKTWERHLNYFISDAGEDQCDRRGYMLRYPSLASMSPLMLSCLLRIRLLLRSLLLLSMPDQFANDKQ
ncbi:hypothetical protein CJF32_00003425 [Rutstroemia sp. NJR-2017a WRK4]|nr:hypothetical protein CJF32_00003425 [Rutstroemia sp. NJR-2017a WRK4]